MLRIVVTTLVVAVAFAAAVSVKFKRSALEPTAEPMEQSDDLHLHLRTAPLGLPNRAKPVMRRREA